MNSNSSISDYIINHKNIGEYPVKFLKLILKKLEINELFARYVRDPRCKNKRYAFHSLLMYCISNHFFRSPSKNHFHQHFKRSEASYAMAKFCGMNTAHCPVPRTVDDVLLNLKPEEFQPILPAIFRSLCRQKVFQLHPEFIPDGEYAIATDGVVTHTYYDHSQHPCRCCPYCLKRTRGNKVWYLHLNLIASFIAPNGLQIPLFIHRVRARPEWGQLGDNEWKQECERTALPFLLGALRKEFPRLRFCIHLDALFATDPTLTLLKELKMGFSIVKKAKVLKTVGSDCSGLKQFSQPVEVNVENTRFKIQQTIHFFNDVSYREHDLHIIQVDENAEKKESKRFAKILSKKTHWEWIVHQHLDVNNVHKRATGSRIRWKQEDSFNELKNRGFAICHDFNRAPHIQTIRMHLVLIAYAISSILTHSLLIKRVLSRGYTILFLMKQMLNDLIYLPDMVLTESHHSIQLRFARGPP
jgi:hypothetical protein